MPFKYNEQVKVLSEEQEQLYDEQMYQKYYNKAQRGFLEVEEDQNIASIQYIDKYINNLQYPLSFELLIYNCQNLSFSRVSVSIHNLNIMSCNLQTIAGIQQMKQLTRLRIYNNECFLDISELIYLVNLKNLCLENNLNFQDISPLKYLKNITKLCLSRNIISDIQSLQYLTELTQLNLTENCIVNIYPLQNLFKLNELELSQNPIVHIHALKNLKQLHTLDLNQTLVIDISPVEPLERGFSFEDLLQPTQFQFMSSYKFKSIYSAEELIQKLEQSKIQFKHKIQLFNKRITKPYKNGHKTHQKFLVKIQNLFALNSDASFDQ
ncbi:leucine-rich_repeat domain-containing protein [Hexamita inflata]|uniref:Leucine-rich repeat domain-containing protein n=1 Tax=Hexamita inflata TaxID=28002 RepID=A0AA86PYA0_9EUKA|nr:leucine-rich repeat domain-containing protein [Hexamita inflata]